MGKFTGRGGGWVLLWIGVAAGWTGAAWAEEDAPDVRVEERRAGNDARKTYFLFQRAQEEKPPPAGFGLVLILPGGDGSAEFKPFVTRVYARAVPKGFLAAELVAVKWTPNQEVVWPTMARAAVGQQFPTEQFIMSVVADIRSKFPLDARRIFALTWSSSGPAGYAASMAPKTPITGSLVAMSVFNAKQLPPLIRAKGQAYYIYHSPQDQTCPIWMARWARNALKQNGAETTLVEYEGGHGWSSGDPWGDIRKGLEWLIAARERMPAASRPATAPAEKARGSASGTMKFSWQRGVLWALAAPAMGRCGSASGPVPPCLAWMSLLAALGQP